MNICLVGWQPSTEIKLLVWINTIPMRSLSNNVRNALLYKYNYYFITWYLGIHFYTIVVYGELNVSFHFISPIKLAR